ncbi:MAG: redoxin family protein [Planctomycetota bacterium]
MLSLLAALTLSAAPATQDVTLRVGDAAPALRVEHWIKGEPVPSFERGKVYVIEFWATWCGPCIAAMPHLSELQAKYKESGVTIIGMTSEDRRNTLEGAQKMTADKGDGMGYTVAWDRQRETNTAYMKAAGRGGIPCSFLIDRDGKLAYVGHPMWLDAPLAGVVAGGWDIEAGNAKLAEVQAVYGRIRKMDDPEKAIAAIAKFRTGAPALAHLVEDYDFTFHLRAGKYAAAYKLCAAMVDQAIAKKDATKLNGLAWKIVDPRTDYPERDLDLALRAAKASVELDGGANAASLDTLARVYFLRGELQRAIELQRKAVEVAPERQKAGMREVLGDYEQAAA